MSSASFPQGHQRPPLGRFAAECFVCGQLFRGLRDFEAHRDIVRSTLVECVPVPRVRRGHR